MIFLTAIGGVVVLLFLMLVFFITGILILGKFYDKWALQAARKYCGDNDLEYIKAEAYPNHYGLYFCCKGKRLYARYDFGRNRTITWKQGSPLEIAAEKFKR
jgi:hypothetical protein